MKTLVVFYSMSGNTKYVAEKIKEKIDADLLELIPKKEYPSKGFRKYLWGGKSAIMKDKPTLEDYSFNANDYDLIVFGSPVWASHAAPPLNSFINDNYELIKDKKFAGYVCYMGSGAKEALDQLKAQLKIGTFEDELILIDPKNKPTEEKEQKIEEFINRIKGV